MCIGILRGKRGFEEDGTVLRENLMDLEGENGLELLYVESQWWSSANQVEDTGPKYRNSTSRLVVSDWGLRH